VIGANYNHRVSAHDAHASGNIVVSTVVREVRRSITDDIGHAEVVLKKSLRLFAREPKLYREDLYRVRRPVLVMAGDDDVAKLSHTCALFEAMPDAQLAIIPARRTAS